MIQKITKPLCILADANVIIEIHALGIWAQFTNQCHVITTEYIQQHEAKYFKSKKENVKVTIDLSSYITNGQLHLISADATDLKPIYDTFDSVFIDSIDSGEIEALALIMANKHQNALLCSGDGRAIQALAMIGKTATGISLQKSLEKSGVNNHQH